MARHPGYPDFVAKTAKHSIAFFSNTTLSLEGDDYHSPSRTYFPFYFYHVCGVQAYSLLLIQVAAAVLFHLMT